MGSGESWHDGKVTHSNNHGDGWHLMELPVVMPSQLMDIPDLRLTGQFIGFVRSSTIGLWGAEIALRDLCKDLVKKKWEFEPDYIEEVKQGEIPDLTEEELERICIGGDKDDTPELPKPKTRKKLRID